MAHPRPFLLAVGALTFVAVGCRVPDSVSVRTEPRKMPSSTSSSAIAAGGDHLPLLRASQNALDAARLDNRPVTLFFHNNRDPESVAQVMRLQNAYPDVLLVHLNDNAATIEDDAIARRFNVTSRPSFLFLDGSGTERGRASGTLTDEALSQRLRETSSSGR